MPLHLMRPTLAPLALRLGLATILFYHGLLKLFYHGGIDWSPNLGIPPEAQVAIAWVELLSGIAIAVGFLTRFAALLVAAIQIGAIVLVTGQRDFISINRLGIEDPHGYRFSLVGWEYNFALLTIAVTLMLLGSGTWSLNNLFLSVMKRPKEQSAATPPAAATPA